jgi:hypothetical protein
MWYVKSIASINKQMEIWISQFSLKNSTSEPSKSLAQGTGNKKQQNCLTTVLYKVNTVYPLQPYNTLISIT